MRAPANHDQYPRTAIIVILATIVLCVIYIVLFMQYARACQS